MRKGSETTKLLWDLYLEASEPFAWSLLFPPSAIGDTNVPKLKLSQLENVLSIRGKELNNPVLFLKDGACIGRRVNSTISSIDNKLVRFVWNKEEIVKPYAIILFILSACKIGARRNKIVLIAFQVPWIRSEFTVRNAKKIALISQSLS